MRERRGTGRGRGAPPADDLLSSSVEALAVLLDAGVAPRSAWQHAGAEARHPAIVRVAALIGSGAPPAEALAAAARGDGARLAAIAAAWDVAEEAGAALAPALRGAAESLRDRADAERDVATALAGPRATTRLMAWLPVVGVVMAYVIGVDVVGALIGGPLGWAAATGGAGLLLGGRAWTRRLLRDASRSGPVAGAGHDLVAIALAGGLSAPAACAIAEDAAHRAGLAVEVTGDGSVARVLGIAERAGAPAIELLTAEARQERRTARADGRRKAELLAVRLLLPLGVCVLPAFVLLGVVPVVLAMMSSTFEGLG